LLTALFTLLFKTSNLSAEENVGQEFTLGCGFLSTEEEPVMEAAAAAAAATGK
jgi:hypothetical protein